jgi:uncharacterized protein (TIGR02217 family)
MNFHEVRFPSSLSLGSSGGPERRTEIVTLSNGHEERNSPWAHSRRRYDAGLGLRSMDDIAVLIAFFEARHGQLYGFRWKDWADFKTGLPSAPVTAMDQDIGEGDGSTTVFQLNKTYSSGEGSYRRPIRKPVAGSLRLALAGTELVEGTDFAMDGASGMVTFGLPPPPGAIISAGFEFDVPVRFATDRLEISAEGFGAGAVPSVPVLEVKV